MRLPSVTPVTTVHQPHTLTTTTTVNPTSANQTPSPALRTRPAGWHTYLQLSDFFFDIDKDLFSSVDMDDLEFLMEKNFYLTHTVKNYEDYLDSKPEPLQALKSQQILHFAKEQLFVLLKNHSELNFDEFSRTVKSVWPFISDDNKNENFY